MGKVKDILQNKGRSVFSVDPETMVYKAIELMCEKNIGGLMIVEGGSLVGILSLRSIRRR